MGTVATRPVTPWETRKHGFVLEVAHAPTGWHQWIYLDNGRPMIARRDWLGRKARRNTFAQEWLRVRCNNSQCPAIALVRVSSILAKLEGYLPAPDAVWPDSSGYDPTPVTPPIPDELCGFVGCVYLKGHTDTGHSWDF